MEIASQLVKFQVKVIENFLLPPGSVETVPGHQLSLGRLAASVRVDDHRDGVAPSTGDSRSLWSAGLAIRPPAAR